jgi:hypothetical protein
MPWLSGIPFIWGAFPKCDIFLAHEEHHNLPPDNTVP